MYGYVGTVGKPGIETNLYGYSFSDPVNFIDTNGKWALPAAAAIVTAFAVYDIWKYVKKEPSVCGKVENYVRSQASPEFRDFFNIPDPDPNLD